MNPHSTGYPPRVGSSLLGDAAVSVIPSTFGISNIQERPLFGATDGSMKSPTATVPSAPERSLPQEEVATEEWELETLRWWRQGLHDRSSHPRDLLPLPPHMSASAPGVSLLALDDANAAAEEGPLRPMSALLEYPGGAERWMPIHEEGRGPLNVKKQRKLRVTFETDTGSFEASRSHRSQVSSRPTFGFLRGASSHGEEDEALPVGGLGLPLAVFVPDRLRQWRLCRQAEQRWLYKRAVRQRAATQMKASNSPKGEDGAARRPSHLLPPLHARLRRSFSAPLPSRPNADPSPRRHELSCGVDTPLEAGRTHEAVVASSSVAVYQQPACLALFASGLSPALKYRLCMAANPLAPQPPRYSFGTSFTCVGSSLRSKIGAMKKRPKARRSALSYLVELPRLVPLVGTTAQLRDEPAYFDHGMVELMGFERFFYREQLRPYTLGDTSELAVKQGSKTGYPRLYMRGGRRATSLPPLPLSYTSNWKPATSFHQPNPTAKSAQKTKQRVLPGRGMGSAEVRLKVTLRGKEKELGEKKRRKGSNRNVEKRHDKVGVPRCAPLKALQDGFVFHPLVDRVGTGAYSKVYGALPILSARCSCHGVSVQEAESGEQVLPELQPVVLKVIPRSHDPFLEDRLEFMSGETHASKEEATDQLPVESPVALFEDTRENSSTRRSRRQHHMDKLEEVEREVHLLCRLQHSGCARFVGAFKTPFEFAIAMSLLPGSMNVRDCLQAFGPLPEHRAGIFVFQLLSTLSYLHETFGVLHRDIKLENVVLSMLDEPTEEVEQEEGQEEEGDAGGSETLPTDAKIAAILGETFVPSAHTHSSRQNTSNSSLYAFPAHRLLRATLIDFGLARRTPLPPPHPPTPLRLFGASVPTPHREDPCFASPLTAAERVFPHFSPTAAVPMATSSPIPFEHLVCGGHQHLHGERRAPLLERAHQWVRSEPPLTASPVTLTGTSDALGVLRFDVVSLPFQATMRSAKPASPQFELNAQKSPYTSPSPHPGWAGATSPLPLTLLSSNECQIPPRAPATTPYASPGTSLTSHFLISQSDPFGFFSMEEGFVVASRPWVSGDGRGEVPVDASRGTTETVPVFSLKHSFASAGSAASLPLEHTVEPRRRGLEDLLVDTRLPTAGTHGVKEDPSAGSAATPKNGEGGGGGAADRPSLSSSPFSQAGSEGQNEEDQLSLFPSRPHHGSLSSAHLASPSPASMPMLLVSPCGTERYFPPEMIQFLMSADDPSLVGASTRLSTRKRLVPLDEAWQQDLYAVGMVAHVLLSGCFPFNATSRRGQWEQQMQGPRCNSDRWVGRVSEEAVDFVRRMLHPDPQRRFPTASIALEHPFMTTARARAVLLGVVPRRDGERLPEKDRAYQVLTSEWLHEANGVYQSPTAPSSAQPMAEPTSEWPGSTEKDTGEGPAVRSPCFDMKSVEEAHQQHSPPDPERSSFAFDKEDMFDQIYASIVT